MVRSRWRTTVKPHAWLKNGTTRVNTVCVVSMVGALASACAPGRAAVTASRPTSRVPIRVPNLARLICLPPVSPSTAAGSRLPSRHRTGPLPRTAPGMAAPLLGGYARSAAIIARPAAGRTGFCDIIGHTVIRTNTHTASELHPVCPSH